MPIMSGKFHGTMAPTTPVVSQGVAHRGKILSTHGRHRFSGVQAFQLNELVLMLADEARQTQERVPAIRSAHLTPGAFEGGPGRAHGRVDIFGPGLGYAREHLFRRGVQRLKVTAGQCRHSLTADQQIFPPRQIRAAGRGFYICTTVHILAPGLSASRGGEKSMAWYVYSWEYRVLALLSGRRI
jgi:hypothetical protein